MVREVNEPKGGMHLESSIALLVAIAIILLLIKLRLHVGYAIIAGAAFLSLATLSPEESLLLGYHTLKSPDTLRLLFILFSVLTLSFTMESMGMLENITNAFSQVGGKSALIAVPLVIGLLPMPGGALVSAMMIAGLVRGREIERATFANYWFRHLWIPSWPLYPAFIITLGVVEIGALELVKANLALTLSSLFAGLLLAHPYLDFRSSGNVKKAVPALSRNAWPIVAIILLALIAGLELSVAIGAVLVLTLLYTRPSFGKMKQIATSALDFRMGVLIVGVMLFRNTIEASGAAENMLNLLESLGLPIIVIAPLMSFLIGFAVGIEMAPPSIALPLFLSFVGKGSEVVPEHLLLIFAAGFFGVQLSPMHLCFTITADYFKASITRLYRYTLPASALSFAVVVGFILLT